MHLRPGLPKLSQGGRGGSAETLRARSPAFGGWVGTLLHATDAEARLGSRLRERERRPYTEPGELLAPIGAARACMKSHATFVGNPDHEPFAAGVPDSSRRFSSARRVRIRASVNSRRIGRLPLSVKCCSGLGDQVVTNNRATARYHRGRLEINKEGIHVVAGRSPPEMAGDGVRLPA